MKTQIVLLFFALFPLVGCETLGSRKLVSRWSALERVESLQCDDWPMRPKDFSVDELHFVSGSTPGFLVSIRVRDGSQVHYWAPFFRKTLLDKDDFINLPFQEGAVIAGGGFYQKKPFVTILQNSTKRARIEVYRVDDSRLLASEEINENEIKEASGIQSKAGLWVRYRKEDNDVYAAFVTEQGKKIQIRSIKNANFRENPVFLPSAVGNETLSVRFEPPQFLLRNLSPTAGSEQDVTLKVPVTEGVESWAVKQDKDRIFLTVLDGDSLIGSAKLSLTTFSNSRGLWNAEDTTSLLLPHVHVSDPLFVKQKQILSLLMMQWVDEESTLARYDLRSGRLEKPKYLGVFPKGSRVMLAFFDEKTEEVFLVVRHKSEDRWNYRLCSF